MDPAEGPINPFNFMDELTSDMARIDTIRDSRRALLADQDRAANVSSSVRDTINRFKPAAIDSRIKLLEEFDNKLYQYIKHLENIHGKIWCTKCNKISNVPTAAEIEAIMTAPVVTSQADNVSTLDKQVMLNTIAQPNNTQPTTTQHNTPPSDSAPFDDVAISALVSKIEELKTDFKVEIKALEGRFQNEIVKIVNNIEKLIT